MTDPTTPTARNWVGRPVVDQDGRALGTCTTVLEGRLTRAPWLLVQGAGARGFVPGRDAVESDGRVRVAVTREQLESAPPTALPEELSETEESTLRRHYATPARAVADSRSTGPRPEVLGLAAAGVVAVVVWVVVQWRRRRAPTPGERIASAGRTASTAVARGAKELVSAAAPVVAQTAHDARVAAVSAGSGAVELAGTAGAVAAKGLHAGAHATGEITGTLAAVPEAVAERVHDLQRGWHKLVNRVVMLVSLSVGYVLGARAGRQRYDQIAGFASRLADRPEARQARAKVSSVVADATDTTTGR
jgi:hypothetical protein